MSAGWKRPTHSAIHAHLPYLAFVERGGGSGTGVDNALHQTTSSGGLTIAF